MNSKILAKITTVALSAVLFNPLAIVQANAVTLSSTKTGPIATIMPISKTGPIAHIMPIVALSTQYRQYQLTSLTTNFPTTYKYSDLAYSGTLQKQGTYVKCMKTIYVAPVSKVVSQTVTYYSSKYPTSISYNSNLFTCSIKISKVQRVIDHYSTSVPGKGIPIYKYLVTYVGNASTKGFSQIQKYYTQMYSGKVSVKLSIRF